MVIVVSSASHTCVSRFKCVLTRAREDKLWVAGGFEVHLNFQAFLCVFVVCVWMLCCSSESLSFTAQLTLGSVKQSLVVNLWCVFACGVFLIRETSDSWPHS